LLSEEIYQAGIERIKADVRRAQSNNEQAIFKSDFWVRMIMGMKP